MVSQNDEPEHVIDVNNRQTSIVATIDGVDISLANLDQAIQLRKYDLAWSLYELRLQHLYGLIDEAQERNDAALADIQLQPPAPPRLDIPTNGRYINGPEDAPVKLVVFCSYQSAPCMRMQPIFKQLRAYYGDLLGIVPYDLPMVFHRYGRSAANAARCADALGSSERFREGMYADITQLNLMRYLSLATQLGIDPDSFRQCYDNADYDTLIQQDIDFGNSLNGGNVPLIFVNGLYAKGLHSAETYARIIEQELQRLGLQVNPPSTEKSSGTDAASTPDNASADTDAADTNEGRNELPVSVAMTLSRDWVDAHLLNQTELEKSFKPAEHRVNEQFYLLKLADIHGTDFYTTLGLQERDVIMQVNGEWLHSGQNTLWDQLYTQDRVSLVIMRKGLPRRYEFSIQ